MAGVLPSSLFKIRHTSTTSVPAVFSATQNTETVKGRLRKDGVIGIARLFDTAAGHINKYDGGVNNPSGVQAR
jgi:hypothetical protein